MTPEIDLPKIKFLSRTCCACPSQWEGSFYDGRFFYARYRNDIFKAYIAPNEKEWFEDCKKYKIYELDTKLGGYDGYMTDEVMEWLLHFFVNFKEVSGPYNPSEVYNDNEIM
jgi:hypothetical protein